MGREVGADPGRSGATSSAAGRACRPACARSNSLGLEDYQVERKTPFVPRTPSKMAR